MLLQQIAAMKGTHELPKDAKTKKQQTKHSTKGKAAPALRRAQHAGPLQPAVSPTFTLFWVGSTVLYGLRCFFLQTGAELPLFGDTPPLGGNTQPGVKLGVPRLRG